MGPILYAHRGAAAELPENTMPAFERALELGADALETDAHLTRDGHVVLSHDATGRRMAGVAQEIRASTLEEVRAWDVGFGFIDASGERPFRGKGFRMPTLDEALRAMPEVMFNVDAKQLEPDMIPALLDVVDRAAAADRVRIASFHTKNLRKVRAARYRGQTGLGQQEVARLVFQPAMVLRRFPVAGDAAQVPLTVGPVRLDTHAFLTKAHALGLRVDYWTINEPYEAMRLLRLGADGVMTDDPARIAPVVRTFRGARA